MTRLEVESYMAEAQAALSGASIVLLGSFNPGIFQPIWFASSRLIPKGEAEAAKNLLITSEFSRFETEWLGVEVLSERASFTTHLTPYFGPLRDLAESTMNLLPHTPVTALGLTNGKSS
jgi:hypothetical protein